MNKTKTFSSLAEFRQLPEFKSLTPYKRKAIIICLKEVPDINNFYIKKDRFYFESEYLRQLINENITHGIVQNQKTTQDENVSGILLRMMVFNFCIHYVGENLFSLYRFTIKKSGRNPEYVYHMSNTPPDVILKHGLNPNYSMNTCKAFPPFIFVGITPCWFGKYVYKIKVNQPLFIDTNLDWRMLDVKDYLCMRNNIPPELIELI